MNSQTRLLLWAGLGFLLWLNFQAWTKDHAPVVKETPTAQASAANAATSRLFAAAT